MINLFANGPENRDSIPGRIIRKTEMVLDASLHYKIRMKEEWSNPG